MNKNIDIGSITNIIDFLHLFIFRFIQHYYRLILMACIEHLQTTEHYFLTYFYFITITFTSGSGPGL
jgi:hypothetical protein